MDTVIQTIKKLLELADEDKNSSQGERDNAMATVHALLAKHNLSLAQVSEPTYEASAFEVEFKTDPWTRTVMAAVCLVTFTSMFKRTVVNGRKRTERMMLVGTETNVQAAISLGKSLTESIKREAKKATKEELNSTIFKSLFNADKFKKSFCLGAAIALMAKAQEMKKHEAADQESTALVLVTNALEGANKKYLNSLNARKGRASKQNVDGNAFNQGAEFGQSLDFKTSSGNIGAMNRLGG